MPVATTSQATAATQRKVHGVTPTPIAEIGLSANGVASHATTFRPFINADVNDVNKEKRESRTTTASLSPKSGLKKLACLRFLEACGRMAAPHAWQFTFANVETMRKFKQEGDFKKSNCLEARFAAPRHRSSTRFLQFFLVRCHWVPYSVPMEIALKELAAIPGITILSSKYENIRDPEMEHVRSGVRAVVIDTAQENSIPYILKWAYNGQKGSMC
jgi:hypothetical protein